MLAIPASAFAQAQEPPPKTVVLGVEDGVRFRGGISAGGGGWVSDNFGAGLGGIDGRLGIQINHLFAVYSQTHLSFGAATISNLSGATGMFAESVLVEVTLADRFFIGAGA